MLMMTLVPKKRLQSGPHMAAQHPAPSIDETRRLLQELENVADEVQQFRERLSELDRSESKPRFRQRRQGVDDYRPAKT